MSENPENENRENELTRESLRIQEELEKYLGKEKALEVAAKIYAIASEISELVHKITRDPEIAENYDYDGKRLMKKRKGYEPNVSLRLFDGLNVLKNLDESTFRGFFRSDKDEFIALEDFLEHVRGEYDNALMIWMSVDGGTFTDRPPKSL